MVVLLAVGLISNKNVEQQTEYSSSDKPNGEIDEEKSTHYDAGENPMDELIIEEIKKHRISCDTQAKGNKNLSKKNNAWRDIS